MKKMERHHTFLAVALIAAIIAHSCTMPNSIEIKSDKFKTGLPVRLGSFNIAEIISKRLADSFEGFQIYDMVNYSGSPAQTFLAAYTQKFRELYDPADELEKMKKEFADVISKSLEENISFDQAIARLELEPEKRKMTISYPIGEEFEEMVDFMNTTNIQTENQPLQAKIGCDTETLGLGNSMSSFVTGSISQVLKLAFDNSGYEFGALVLGEGTMTLTFNLNPYSTAPFDNIDITLGGIGLGYGFVDYDWVSVGVPNKTEVNLTAINPSSSVEIDLAGIDIKRGEPLQFMINTVTDNYEGDPETAYFMFSAKVELSDIIPRGVKGLKLEEEIFEGELLDSLTSTLNLDDFFDTLDDFINAEIGAGSYLSMEIGLPQKSGDHHLNPKTYCEGLSVEYEIYIDQPVDNTTITGEQFAGLSGGEGSIPWRITNQDEINKHDATFDLSGKSINKKGMRIVNKTDDPNNYTRVVLKNANQNGIDIEFFGMTDDEWYLPVDIEINLEIPRLEVVRWKLKNDQGGYTFDIGEDILIDFENMNGTDITKYIDSISYNAIKIELDFEIPDSSPPANGLPVALQGKLALGVDCPQLGFKIDPDNINNGNPRILETVGSSLLFELTGDPKVDLELAGLGEIPVKLNLFPIINNKVEKDCEYMELGPVIFPENEDFNLIMYAQPKYTIDWTSAKINLKNALEEAEIGDDAFSGQFPKDDAGINISEDAGEYLGEKTIDYLQGITLGENIQTKIYIAGLPELIDRMDLSLTFGATWQESDGNGGWEDGYPAVFYSSSLTRDDLSPFPNILPYINNKGQYTGKSLPPGGLEIESGEFIRAVSSFPRELRFNYDLQRGEDIITVTRTMYDDLDNIVNDLGVMVLMIIPLELDIAAGTEFSIDDVFMNDDSDPIADIFGRKNADEFADFNIRSLSIGIEFERAFYNGAYLQLGKYMEEGVNKPFPGEGKDGFILDAGSSWGITLDNNHWNILKHNLIVPEIKIMFPEDISVIVPRNFLPTRLAITVSGNYTIDINI